MQPQVAKTQSIPHLDESTFQQILQAAYIIQQHSDTQNPAALIVDPESSLALIADTQELLHSQHYDIASAARLVLERLTKITQARGLAIALVSNEQLTYCAAVGNLSSLAGQSGPIATDVSEFLRKEEVLQRGPDDSRSDLLEKRDKAPVFFSIYCDGRIAALLQLSFPKSESIQKHEIRSCQLMAGLLGESISRAADVELKESMEAERATMLAALERLRPQLQRLAEEPPEESTGAATPALPPEVTAKLSHLSSATEDDSQLSEDALKAVLSDPAFAEIVNRGLSTTCSDCGAEFTDGEKFCGKCGNPLSHEGSSLLGETADSHAANDDGNETLPLNPIGNHISDMVREFPLPAADKPDMQPAGGATAIDGNTALAIAPQTNDLEIAEGQDHSELQLVPEPEKSEDGSQWTSATKTRQWLDSVKPADSGWLAKHGGDVSVATAALVLVLVIFGWNSRPAARPVPKAPSQPSLSLFERLMVNLGVAEAPAAPIPLGNPNVQVWEDLHTGLYYCPGAELYGKTSGGKLTNQRDAQLDQFEPAARKTCD